MIRNNDQRFKIWVFHGMTLVLLIGATYLAWRLSHDAVITATIMCSFMTLFIPIHFYGSESEVRVSTRIADRAYATFQARLDADMKQSVHTLLDDYFLEDVPTQADHQFVPDENTRHNLDRNIWLTDEQLEVLSFNTVELNEQGEYVSRGIKFTRPLLVRSNIPSSWLKDKISDVGRRYTLWMNEWKRAKRLDSKHQLTDLGVEFLSGFYPPTENHQ